MLTEALPELKRKRRRFRRSIAGQVLPEACIGMALLAFVWILFTFTGYMSNNRIRALMASRYASWLSGNEQDPRSAGIPAQFFYGPDTNYVTVQAPAGLTLSLGGLISGSLLSQDSQGWSQQSGQANAWKDTVSFGMQTNFTNFPFTLMNTQVPFMTNSLLANFTVVQSSCAWPADVNDSWQSFCQAMKGVVQAFTGECSSDLGGLGAVLGAISSLISSISCN